MKVKARDVVEGWPRGRTTLTFVDTPEDLEFYQRRWTNRPYADPWLQDLARSVAYHQEQQQMATAYLERWRLPPVDSKMRPLPAWELEMLQRLKVRPIASA